MTDDIDSTQEHKPAITGSGIYDCGLTPMYVRLAANFLDKGVGKHQHEKLDNFGYDYAEVEVLNKWERYETPDGNNVWSKEYRVSFYKNGRAVKWVDFSMSMSGGGGQPAFTVYNGDEVDKMKKSQSPWAQKQNPKNDK